jgi:hypothetical protein
MRDMKPSSIIEASRASNLNALGINGEFRIGYGLVHDEAGRSVPSFGIEGNVTKTASGVINTQDRDHFDMDREISNLPIP